VSLIQSMTGFATVSGSSSAELSFTLSAKSVNHRFLDLQFRLPPGSDGLEMRMRALLKERIKRGHVDITLTLERSSTRRIRLHSDVLAAYLEAFREAAASHHLASEPDLNRLLGLPGVTSAEAGPGRDSTAGLEEAVISAMSVLLDKLEAARAEEGATLAGELRSCMLRIREAGAEIEALRSGVRYSQFDRLRERLTQLTSGAGLNEDRILTEAAMLAERSDIEEETIRLRTHVDSFLVMLDAGGELGKRLDFLLQEFNREANTMLSKTSGATGTAGVRITELGLAIKAEIEKLREQVQNIE
jgi:uncharacterized protein (TIGR00255 family)